MLYEKLGRETDAVAAYEKYLELSPSAIDRGRIQRRIEALKEKLK
jgi:predicted RNA polymerase sigma factor